MGVIYEKNVFCVHCINDKKEYATLIKRTKFLISRVALDDIKNNAFGLPKFLTII